MITNYHANYYAHELSRIGGTGADRLDRALFDACVDLNPHQIEAALFALRSPLSQGVLLADEVGLGKTIEAGLVVCQYWAERKRNIMVISPASLRKQWAQELSEKFNLPSIVLDAKTYNDLQKSDISNPFRNRQIIICSMHFAARRAEEIKEIAWDLIIIDEAHKLRNAYRTSNHLGQRIRWGTEGRKKLLLTATPLQNSLLELYGLSTLIDQRLFGDLASFRTQYVNYGGNLPDLRDRLRNFCWRNLRRHVVEFVRYTERKPITVPFKPTTQEQKLYEAVSSYLMREETYALPSGQKHLLILLVRKVLASSPRALVGTLEIMRDRLLKLRDKTKQDATILDKLISDEDIDNDLLDEILDGQEDVSPKDKNPIPAPQAQTIDLQKLNAEIQELTDYIRWAKNLGIDTKTKALLKALDIGFNAMEEMGAAKKVVIFTESRRTQIWLQNFLEENGYAGQVLTFNGSNQDDASTQIYHDWLAANKQSGRATGSRQIDIKTAIIDRFRDQANILIATEAGAEGLNLQFCSAVINFDLPWNPQRIEQRIGRCHRYGQKHDVVVINFLNEKNEADRRVHELLEQKFNLFTGIFGASDDVLGSIESGVDFERRILEIYQGCRSEEEIRAAFEKLQTELDEQIQTKMRDTRKILLEHFDEDVHERLKVNLAGTHERLDRIGRLFWAVTTHVLHHHAKFDDQNFSFILQNSPIQQVSQGRYHLISKTHENVPGEYLYRLSHPLGEYVIHKAANLACPPAEVLFDISNHSTRIAVVERLKGRSGWLSLQHLLINSFDAEEYLLFSGMDDTGTPLDQETCEKLFHCSGQVRAITEIPSSVLENLKANQKRHAQATLAKNLEENNRHFSEARDQLDKWAEDMEMAAQKKLDDTKRQIRDLQRRSRQAPTIEEQYSLQAEIAQLERKKRTLREQIFDIEDEIAEKRDRLVESLEKRMQQKTKVTPVFTIRWSVI
ncbi:SNF2-related protein [Desulfoplanes formicivorans]|uniref:ATP-dependent helicase n=1 Tax=Desulfoplanes formicivorans TaxID=1592317 RepID=A0A194AJ51_9BACT|nr:SNF2-related protein [Desulfoplanes formicivorans]GAU09091.1 ATP-dependent helicase [Desulfoplanes formicivorans]